MLCSRLRTVCSSDLSDITWWVRMDDTGTTHIGKWEFNHSFFIPGVLVIFFSVALGFAVCGLI
ncbi:hypothetical protein [Parasutterella excrementihominis]|uniref:hypothetical protein n=1 Tax=Parasutterella excrementihominis TaxID=487175 RepID=UPI00266FED25|nr:hypothetical protein [Parasutterella excrementihominis]